MTCFGKWDHLEKQNSMLKINIESVSIESYLQCIDTNTKQITLHYTIYTTPQSAVYIQHNVH